MTREAARWMARYRLAFEHMATPRPGWTAALAQEWSGELAPEAWQDFLARGITPELAASRDVLAVEAEWQALY